MTLYFAYGSNMSRSLMQSLCPGAAALGRAQLRGWGFGIMTSGYASITPEHGGVVHGILWRLSPRDRAVLDAYEQVGSGLYRRRLLPVQFGPRMLPAQVYVGNARGQGRAKPAYCRLVTDAAREWKLPEGYVAELDRRLRSSFMVKSHVRA